MHMIMWIMSDRTIPRSFRFMEGFGVHTFRLINRKGKSTFVKVAMSGFRRKPKLGIRTECTGFAGMEGEGWGTGAAGEPLPPQPGISRSAAARVWTIDDDQRFIQ